MDLNELRDKVERLKIEIKLNLYAIKLQRYFRKFT